MSEADRWRCSQCQSLNDLSAHRCCSCGRKKPRDAVRASELLGYRVVESWDGKVRLEQLNVAAAELVEDGPLPAEPRPLREPIHRSIAAIAPRPGGARITYRRAPGSMSSSLFGPGLPWTVPGALPPSVPGVHLTPPAVPPMAPGVPVPTPSGPPSLVAVGPGSPPGPAPTEPSWPHWRQLLDGPQPDGERIRSTYDHASDTPEAALARTHAHGGSLSRAIKGAQRQRIDPEPEWPAHDRPAGPSADPIEVGEFPPS